MRQIALSAVSRWVLIETKMSFHGNYIKCTPRYLHIHTKKENCEYCEQLL